MSEAETRTRMLQFTFLAAIVVGALSSFTLSVMGVFILSIFVAGFLFLVPIGKPFSTLEIAAVLAVLQVAYLAYGLITSFVRIRR